MPNAKVLSEKQAIVAALTEKLQGSVAGVIVDYSGITVAEDTEMRRKLRENNVDYSVVKNTLLRFAINNSGLSELDSLLNGTTSLAVSADDPVAPAKIIKEYADKIETFQIKGGFVDGNVLDEAGVNELASIPGKDTLVCKIMMGMQSPLYKLAYALQAIIDKSGEAPAEEAPAAEAAAE